MNIQSILRTARAIQQIHFESSPLTFKAGHTGAMIALFPSFQVVQKLSKFGTEEAKDLHITLAFLGEASEIQDISMLLDTVSVLAKDQLPMSGKINGVGRFNMFDPQRQDVFIALPDVPVLPLFRQNTFEFIKELGFKPLQDHGFIPHITLSYLQSSEPIPTEIIPPFLLQFDDISVVLGEDRYDFPFGDGSMATRAGARNSRIDLKRIQDTHDLCVGLGAICRTEYENKAFVEKKGTRSSGNWGHGGRPGKKGGSGKGGGFGRLGFSKGDKPSAKDVRSKAKERKQAGGVKGKKKDASKIKTIGISQEDFTNQLMTKVQNGEIDFAEAQKLNQEFKATQLKQKVEVGDTSEGRRWTTEELDKGLDKEPWNKWKDGLSDKEKTALIDYSTEPFDDHPTDYTKINNHLRGKDDNPSSETRSAIKELDTALNKGRVSEDTVAFRGLPPELTKDLKPGDIFTDDGFVSTSTDKRISERFSKKNVAEIRVPEGSRGGFMDTVRNQSVIDTLDDARFEHELLLPRGSKFRVLSSNEGGPIMELINE